MSTSIGKISIFSVIVIGLTAFALSLFWYSSIMFGPIWLSLSKADPSHMPAWKMLLAPFREIGTCLFLASLFYSLNINRWQSAVSIAFWLWLIFYGVQIVGAVIWDNMPWPLGLVHLGDWFMKMMVMSVLLALWRSKKMDHERKSVHK